MTALVLIYFLTQFWVMLVIIGLSFFGLAWAILTICRVIRALWLEGRQVWRDDRWKGPR
jgi:uncharacterized membrane protein YesL